MISYVPYPQYQSHSSSQNVTPYNNGYNYVQNHYYQLNEAHPYNQYNQPSLNPNHQNAHNHHFHHASSSPVVPPPPAAASSANLSTTPNPGGANINSLSPNNMQKPSSNLLATPNSSTIHSPNMLTSASSINLAASGGADHSTASSRLIHNSQSCHELYLKHAHHNGMHHGSMQNNSFHFHLAGFIDPEAGIPLQPSISQAKGVPFVVHWMNNKDFHFTYAAELFSREIYEKIREKIKADKRQNGAGSQDSDNDMDNYSDNEETQSNNLSLNKTSAGADDISIVTGNIAWGTARCSLFPSFNLTC